MGRGTSAPGIVGIGHIVLRLQCKHLPLCPPSKRRSAAKDLQPETAHLSVRSSKLRCKHESGS